MGDVAGMIAQARLLLGMGENPPGSNHNIITTWFGVDTPWCDIAISYVAAHSDNLDAVFGKFAWCPAHAQAFQRNGRWRYGLGGVRAGDVVFFDWSGTRLIENIDHVGLVEATHSDNTITTLEGNTSDGYFRRVRNSAVVVGYGRPLYRDAAPLPAGNGMLSSGSVGDAVRTLQRNLNTVMNAHLDVDGDFGPATNAALRSFQVKFHLEVDGEYGPASAAMMKAALAGQSAPVPPRVMAPAPATLSVDGAFGPRTCAALQRALDRHGAGIAVDGAFGPDTRRALQRLLGVAADGAVGPQTIRALQRKVGAAVDGSWGPDTTRRLQRALNAGSF
jgi:peptidoglycan hydrolase-like protein with peptidoglycan-binding domain